MIPSVLKYIVEVSSAAGLLKSLIETLVQFVSDDPQKSITTFLLTAAVSLLSERVLCLED